MQITKVHRRLILMFIATPLVVMCAVVAPVAVLAADPADQSMCTSIGGTWDATGGGTCKTGSTTVQSVIETVVDIMSWAVGIVAVLVIIISGFRFVVSGGDPNATKNARNGIIYAAAGLVVVALAQAIVWFVLGNTT